VGSRRSFIAGAAAMASVGTVDRGTAAMQARIAIEPAVALQDQPLRIRLVGFQPSSLVRVSASMTSRTNVTWRSWATFVADGNGGVDISSAAPRDGSYRGISPMGLVWSMIRDGTAPTPGPSRRIRDPVTIDFLAESDGRTAAASAERHLAGPGVTFRQLEPNSTLRGGWWLPASPAPHPVIIVLGGSGGGADHERAALYASHGYAALALAYFGAPGLPRGLVNIPLEYVGEAIRHAQSFARPRNNFIAVDGISRGGELALLVGATFSEVGAVVSIMGGGLVMGAFGDREPGDDRPPVAWRFNGVAVPNLFDGNLLADWSFLKPGQRIDSLVPGYLSAMRDSAAVERATIRVERIRGPVLLVTGKDDRLAPRFELAEIARRRLEAHSHPWPFQHLGYDDAGHAIAPPYQPTTAASFVHPVSKEELSLGGTVEGRARANEDFWPKVLAFLNAAVSARSPL
jgi:dienelactone hydrolase